MVKQKIYLQDTKLSVVGSSSAITGYVGVNSGTEFSIDADSVSMVIGKTANADVNLGRFDASLFYEEGDLQTNSVANRTFNITGVLDIGDPAKKATNKLIYKYLIQAVRSPAIFKMKNELTIYDDEPNSSLSGYVYVVLTNFQPTTVADDQNIISFTLEAVLVND